MKGKAHFSQAEAKKIRRLLTQKSNTPSSQQKPIRDRLRDTGFYISDFSTSNNGFDCDEFDLLVSLGTITITNVPSITSPSLKSPMQRTVPTDEYRDEVYILDLCDEVLGIKCLRQHRFPFLLGDTGHSLPVDGYYLTFNLVVEYRERQHSESVPLFDQRATVSGVSRGVQRQLYDQRRREVLPKHGIQLIELSFDEFAHNSSKRLKRDRGYDLRIISARLHKYINDRK